MAQDSDFEMADGPAPHPLRDFLVQGGIALALLVVLIQGVYQLGHFLGPMVPFSWEKEVSRQALADFPLTDRGPEAQARRATLQRLADDLVPTFHLPPEMTVTVHYSNQDVVNAFATLGGNIVVYEGLIQRLPSENALSMVIAHEMSHVKHRDAIRGVTGDQLVTLIVGLATGDSALAAQIVSNIQLLEGLKFTRDAEERSDKEGLASLEGHYGHVNGYLQTFDALEDWIRDHGGTDIQPPEFLRDHPDTALRKLKLADIAEQSHWPTKGPLTTLRQANFVPHLKLTPWGPPAATGPETKALPKDTNSLNRPLGDKTEPPAGQDKAAPSPQTAPDKITKKP